MCRSIKPLFNFEPPATEEEIHAAALQFVRKVSGYRAPSQANQEPFDLAISEIETAVTHLLQSLTTHAPKKNREEETLKARAKRDRALAKR